MRLAVPLLLAALLSAGPVNAQDLDFTLNGDDGSLTTRAVQLLILVTVLSLVPAIAIMVTCFPFIVTVFAILRQAIGLQQSPPNMLLISLALFLTYFVMEPVFVSAWESGITPMLNGAVTVEEGFFRTMDPLREFMTERIAPDTFAALA
ncbi:MAG: flagellar biosynthetic protein FliP, partial [Pseudomonadota bacterium]